MSVDIPSTVQMPFLVISSTLLSLFQTDSPSPKSGHGRAGSCEGAGEDPSLFLSWLFVVQLSSAVTATPSLCLGSTQPPPGYLPAYQDTSPCTQGSSQSSGTDVRPEQTTLSETLFPLRPRSEVLDVHEFLEDTVQPTAEGWGGIRGDDRALCRWWDHGLWNEGPGAHGVRAQET